MSKLFVSSRGIRNRNPFNIVRSSNSWRGKTALNPDSKFERFTSMDYGIRAGLLLLRNGYLSKGLNTVPVIIAKYAPKVDKNNEEAYCKFIYDNSPLFPNTVITLQSLSFYHLCKCICKYESDFYLSYDRYRMVINKFNLGF